MLVTMNSDFVETETLDDESAEFSHMSKRSFERERERERERTNGDSLFLRVN
jgi:hypothetical protein